jgi:eukaryotic-like serine/threonine-protein kinase
MLKGLKTWLAGNTGESLGSKEGDSSPASSLMQRFRPVDQLGRGGMAIVHDVEDIGLRRRTALKVMDDAFVNEPLAVEQFVREAQITGQLEHPNIIPFYEFGIDGEGAPYINMRRIDGQVLDDLIPEQASERLQADELAQLVGILIKVCDALAFAHSKGVIHRDIKPENILVGKFGQVYLFDWGIALVRADLATDPVTVDSDPLAAKAQRDGPVIVGTPAYMSPELAIGETQTQDQRTDVFLLGATLYKVLTGRAPFTAKPVAAALRLAQNESAPDPNLLVQEPKLPPELVRIAMKAMARSVDERYRYIADMQRDLQSFLNGAGHLPTVQFAPEEIVIREGDEATQAYLIVSGECEAYLVRDGQRKTLRTLHAGDVFGEMAILTGGTRTSNIVAVTELELRVVTAASLSEGLGMHTAFGAFAKAIAERFIDVERQLQELHAERK